MPSSRPQRSQPDVTNATVSDAILCAALKQGNADALGTIYDRHAGLVHGIALKVLKDTQAAEDLTQDIFLSLAKKHSYNPKRGSLRTYLAVLARSRAIDRLRTKGTSSRAINRLKRSQPQVPTDNRPLEQASQRETSKTVKTALSQLSAEEQQILQMMYFEGQTQAAIAQQMKIPLGTVKTRSRRGLLKMRKILSN